MSPNLPQGVGGKQPSWAENNYERGRCLCEQYCLPGGHGSSDLKKKGGNDNINKRNRWREEGEGGSEGAGCGDCDLQREGNTLGNQEALRVGEEKLQEKVRVD